ncbi:MAG: hypothetical protein ABGZ35_32870 [Planctomycetaceae bacterium]
MISILYEAASPDLKGRSGVLLLDFAPGIEDDLHATIAGPRRP